MLFAEEEDIEDGEGVVRASKEIWPQAERNQVSQVMKKETTLDGFNFVPLLADFEMYKTFFLAQWGDQGDACSFSGFAS